MTVLATWQAWHYGDESTPPFKFIDVWDLTDKRTVNGKLRPIRETEVRYLNYMKTLCNELDSAAAINRRNIPSLGDFVRLYNTDPVQAILPGTMTESGGRVRRADELNWRHAVETMKKRRTE